MAYRRDTTRAEVGPDFSQFSDASLFRMREALDEEIPRREEEFKHAHEYIYATEGGPGGNYRRLINKKTGEYLIRPQMREAVEPYEKAVDDARNTRRHVIAEIAERAKRKRDEQARESRYAPARQMSRKPQSSSRVARPRASSPTMRDPRTGRFMSSRYY